MLLDTDDLGVLYRRSTALGIQPPRCGGQGSIAGRSAGFGGLANCSTEQQMLTACWAGISGDSRLHILVGG